MLTTRKPHEVLGVMQYQLGTNPIRYWELTQEDGSLAASFGDKTSGKEPPAGEDAMDKLQEAFAYLPPGSYTFSGKSHAGHSKGKEFRFRVVVGAEEVPAPAPYLQPYPQHPKYQPVPIQGLGEQEEEDGQAGQIILDQAREIERLKAKLELMPLQMELQELRRRVDEPREDKTDLAAIAGIAQAILPYLGIKQPALAGPPDGYVHAPVAHQPSPAPAPPAPAASPADHDDVLPMLTEEEFDEMVLHLDTLIRNLGKEKVLAALPRIAQLSPQKFDMLAAFAA